MHKERIFSASSGSHRGTSSGNMESCPLRRCVVFSCPLLIFPALPPPSPFCVHRLRRGGGRTGRSLFLWNARARARRADARAARPVLGRAGPSRVAGPVCLPFAPTPASLSSFPSVRPGPSPCRFFCCALRNLPPGASAVPHAVCCAEVRPLPAPVFFSPVCP